MSGWSERLGQLGARLRLGGGSFLEWWGQALASWLPPRWQRALGVDRGRVLLLVSGDVVQVRLQEGGATRGLGELPLQAPGADPLARVLQPAEAELPRWVLVPASHALRPRLSLPLAAAGRLRDVVAFEIDRQTPFSAGAVAFDVRLLSRRDREGRIDAEMVVVPRQRLDPLRASLEPLAPRLSGIDVADADGVPLGVNLLPPAERRHDDPWRPWNLGLATLMVLLVAATLWQLLDNRRAAADALEQRIAADAEASRQAAARRQALQALVAGQAFLDQARAAHPTTVEIMEELSRRLPDDTYLEKLAIDGERIMLVGLSDEAPALVERLQDSPLWESPALAGALQPDPASGRDRFTLVATLATAASPVDTEAADGAQPLR